MNREHGGSGGQEYFKAADVSVYFQEGFHVFGGGDVFGNPEAKWMKDFWQKLDVALKCDAQNQTNNNKKILL